MPKFATKASDNEFYKARIEASSFNDRLSSRDGASEELGIDRTRLARIELGSLNPYPEEVILMADVYNAPQLSNFFCAQICPLGKKTVRVAQMKDIDRLTIQIIAALSEADAISNTILEVAQDGTITPDEEPKIKEVAEALEKISTITQELKLWVMKNIKEGSR